MNNFNAKEFVKELTLNELVEINTEAIENFKAGNLILTEERKKTDICENADEDYSEMEVAHELITEIIWAAANNMWEGMGVAESAKSSIEERYR